MESGAALRGLSGACDGSFSLRIDFPPLRTRHAHFLPYSPPVHGIAAARRSGVFLGPDSSSIGKAADVIPREADFARTDLYLARISPQGMLGWFRMVMGISVYMHLGILYVNARQITGLDPRGHRHHPLPATTPLRSITGLHHLFF
ncbi:uncharacterized protein LAESUDRAFT_724271 [Laetiporus sulphureus 93-53]|uniref:Uncharacterized protein n=1 Tax=Laetiporus sulphureus 93-53 TaxID=1314785 RepID=A0A165F2T4_9APHY|nr:uncharacterized protein LAESUDRAFT_724271 [Laetiporus sulphureus 93-53]KZT08254.1 hypothetical protein LAESUDRAFT_724271 [Laetiporus sulphureus 93-53]